PRPRSAGGAGMSAAALELAAAPRFLVRRLLPADEGAYRRFLQALDGEDLRLRFGGSPRRGDEACIRRFLRGEDARDGVVLAVDRAGEVLGVGRLAADEPEIALVVRSGLKRRGVGSALLAALIDKGRERALPALYGYVLAENQPMLDFAHHHGFR